MSNWISHHGKMEFHRILFLILSLLCSFIANADASKLNSIFVNIYLKFAPNNAIADHIKAFNLSVDKRKIFSRYHLTPFIQKHPIHITLYLTHYKPSKLAQIDTQVARIAKHTKPMIIKAKTIATNSSMYTMLFIIGNEHLQHLSNQMVLSLMNLRDKQAEIPIWAKNNKDKRYSFSHFGSPNVFANYSPHFSLFAADGLRKEDAILLYDELKPLINTFNQSQRRVVAQPIAIGIGLANKQGQIIRELNSFPLDQDINEDLFF